MVNISRWFGKTFEQRRRSIFIVTFTLVGLFYSPTLYQIFKPKGPSRVKQDVPYIPGSRPALRQEEAMHDLGQTQKQQ